MEIKFLLYGTLAVGMELMTYYLLFNRTAGLRCPKKHYEKIAVAVHAAVLETVFWAAFVKGYSVSCLTFLIPLILYLPGFIIIQSIYTLSMFRNIFLMLIGATQSILIRRGMILAMGIFPRFDDSYLTANRYLISNYVESYFLLETGLFFLLFFLYGKYKYDKYEYSIKEKGILSVMLILLLLECICCKNQETEKQLWQMLALLQCSLFLFILIDAYIMQTYKGREQEKFHSGIKNQMLYYESIEKNQQEVYKLYHDMKNHLLVLDAAENVQEKYIDQCMNRIRATEGQAETGITYVDILLNDKWKKAQESEIDMSFSVQRDVLEKIEIFDLTILLGNLLDNALEAAKKVTGRRAAISIKSGKNGGCIFIHITNDYQDEPHKKNGEFQTIKKDKKYHGRGFKNVKEAVQKYGGELKTEYDGRKFSVIILLYI